MQKHWWKALSVLLIGYSVIVGFLGDVPARDILNESIRNLYFHVTMWMAMMLLMLMNSAASSLSNLYFSESMPMNIAANSITAVVMVFASALLTMMVVDIVLNV